MVFNPMESGPFWMTKVQRVEARQDQILDEPTTREFTKDELLKVLKKEQEVSAKGKKAAIQAIALEHDLPIWETTQIVVKQWEGNQKAS